MRKASIWDLYIMSGNLKGLHFVVTRYFQLHTHDHNIRVASSKAFPFWRNFQFLGWFIPVCLFCSIQCDPHVASTTGLHCIFTFFLPHWLDRDWKPFLCYTKRRERAKDTSGKFYWFCIFSCDFLIDSTHFFFWIFVSNKQISCAV